MTDDEYALVCEAAAARGEALADFQKKAIFRRARHRTVEDEGHAVLTALRATRRVLRDAYRGVPSDPGATREAIKKSWNTLAQILDRLEALSGPRPGDPSERTGEASAPREA